MPDGSIRLWLSFQKVVYTYDDEKRRFQALTFDTARPLEQYFNSKGFETDETRNDRALVYGDNE